MSEGKESNVNEGENNENNIPNPVISRSKLIFIFNQFTKSQISYNSFLLKPSLITLGTLLIIIKLLPISNYTILIMTLVILPLYYVSVKLMYRIWCELLFYNSFYDTVKYNQKIVSSKNNGVRVYIIDAFDNSFNIFRKYLKNNIGNINSPLLTHDYMTDSTFQSIDVFFDVVIQSIYKERADFISENVARLIYVPEERRLPQDMVKYMIDNEIDGINHDTLYIFLNSFYDTFFERPNPLSTKAITIKYYFENWNRLLYNYQPDLFDESREKISKFYDEKYLKYESLTSVLYRISENFFAAFLAIIFSIIASIIVYYTLKP